MTSLNGRLVDAELFFFRVIAFFVCVHVFRRQDWARHGSLFFFFFFLSFLYAGVLRESGASML